MITSATKKTFLRYLSIALLCTSGIAWGSPKGSQFITLDMLKDPKVLEDAVDDMTDDTKGKQFGKINKVVIPSYYIEFRTVSSGKALKKGFKDISVNAHVTYTNADQAVMEAIATEGLADLKAQFTAAGYEVVEPGDNTATEEYKKLFLVASGNIAESTAQPIGWSKFMSMYASAGGAPMYYVIPGEPLGQGNSVSGIMAVIQASQNYDGVVWKKSGGGEADIAVVRSRMILDFVTFVSDTGVEYNGLATNEADKFRNYASISAIPQIQVWLPSLCATRTYIYFFKRWSGDDFGCVNVNGDIQLASKIIGDELGTITGIEGNSGDFNFTANNDKYKEAAIAQIKVTNALLVAKAKSFK